MLYTHYFLSHCRYWGHCPQKYRRYSVLRDLAQLDMATGSMISSWRHPTRHQSTGTGSTNHSMCIVAQAVYKLNLWWTSSRLIYTLYRHVDIKRTYFKFILLKVFYENVHLTGFPWSIIKRYRRLFPSQLNFAK